MGGKIGERNQGQTLGKNTSVPTQTGWKTAKSREVSRGMEKSWARAEEKVSKDMKEGEQGLKERWARTWKKVSKDWRKGEQGHERRWARTEGKVSKDMKEGEQGLKRWARTWKKVSKDWRKGGQGHERRWARTEGKVSKEKEGEQGLKERWARTRGKVGKDWKRASEDLQKRPRDIGVRALIFDAWLGWWSSGAAPLVDCHQMWGSTPLFLQNMGVPAQLFPDGFSCKGSCFYSNQVYIKKTAGSARRCPSDSSRSASLSPCLFGPRSKSLLREQELVLPLFSQMHPPIGILTSKSLPQKKNLALQSPFGRLSPSSSRQLLRSLSCLCPRLSC